MTKGMVCPTPELLYGESGLGPGAESPARAACGLHATTCRGAVLSKGL